MTRETLPRDELIGELVREQLIYHPTVTREPFRTTGRITDPMKSGKLFETVGLPPMDAAHDRFMMCGGPDMIAEASVLLTSKGFGEGNHGEAAHFVIEKAFVAK